MKPSDAFEKVWYYVCFCYIKDHIGFVSLVGWCVVWGNVSQKCNSSFSWKDFQSVSGSKRETQTYKSWSPGVAYGSPRGCLQQCQINM